MLMKARSSSLPLTRPTRSVPLDIDHPSPPQSLVSSSRAYELVRTEKMTPRVRTGSMVPNTGNTAAGAAIEVFADSGLFFVTLELALTTCGVGGGFNGRSSTNRVCVGLAWLCVSDDD